MTLRILVLRQDCALISSKLLPYRTTDLENQDNESCRFGELFDGSLHDKNYVNLEHEASRPNILSLKQFSGAFQKLIIGVILALSDGKNCRHLIDLGILEVLSIKQSL